MLANLLGMYGHRVIVLEMLDSLIDYPRAVGLDDESFRLIQTIGLAREIEPLTGPMHIMRLVSAKGKTIIFNDPQIANFGWPRKNAFNQPLVDRELLRGLDRFDNVEVRFGCTVQDVVEDADGVTVTVVQKSDKAEQTQHIRARYLVGCEGGKSPTRKRLNIPFEGVSPSTRWLVVDVANDPLGTPNVWLGADPKRAYVSIGLPQRVRRFEFRLHDNESDDVVTQPEWVHNVLKDHVPDPTTLDFIRWRVYTHHGRMAKTFRVGRQLIAGDAAHLMPVWLGQGWNSGVRDAMNLGWKLSTVLSNQASDKLLETYTAERQPHAMQMVKLSMTMGNVIKMTNPFAVAARDTAARVVNLVPSWRTYFGEMRFRPQPRYTRGVVVDQTTLAPGRSDVSLKPVSIPYLQAVDKQSAVGVQFPQPRVTTADGRNVLLDEALGTWWSLVLWINDAEQLLDTKTLDRLSALGARLITVVPEAQRPWAVAHAGPNVTVVGDHTGTLKKWFDPRPVGAVLLRPDRFIAGVSLAQQTPQMVDAVLTSMSFLPSSQSTGTDTA